MADNAAYIERHDVALQLYDMPSRFGKGTCWSPNVWKVRMALHLKKINYNTRWLDGPEIAPLFKSFGLTPNPAGIAANDYTIPTVTLPSGTHVMESRRIVAILDAVYPAPKYPSLHLSAPILPRVEAARPHVMKPLLPVLVPLQNFNVFRGVNIQWHRDTRGNELGMSLQEYEVTQGGEPAWEKAMPGLKEWAACLNEDDSGPWCMGTTPSYADCLIIAFLEWTRLCSTECFKRVLAVDPAYSRLYDAAGPFLERNDH